MDQVTVEVCDEELPYPCFCAVDQAVPLRLRLQVTEPFTELDAPGEIRDKQFGNEIRLDAKTGHLATLSAATAAELGP